MTDPHDLESNQNSYQSGLQDGRAARARARELGVEPEPSVADTDVGDRQAYLRGYRAGLNGD